MGCYITDFKTSNPKATALEDSIMKKGAPVTAGSKILEGFAAPFDAAVAERLIEAGFDISGKTRMREFGIPGFCSAPEENGMSGAAEAVLGGVPYALCNDLFGLYRKEAAENGLCYIHPTYGTVPRRGLIPLAPSMDQIGVLCRDMSDGFALLSVISGNDPKDGAMFPEKKYSYTGGVKDLKIRVPRDALRTTDSATREAVTAFAANFGSAEGSLEYFDVYKQVTYILSSAEICNNISRYDGIKFGFRSPNSSDLESLYTSTRTEGFGADVKLTAILGAMALSAEHYAPLYEKSMKIRRLIKQSFTFDGFDVLVLPASAGVGPYDDLALYAPSALAGLPSVTFSYEGAGIQLIAGVKNENALFSAWEAVRT